MKLLNSVHDENLEDLHERELECQRNLLQERLLNSVSGRNLEDLAAEPSGHDHEELECCSFCSTSARKEDTVTVVVVVVQSHARERICPRHLRMNWQGLNSEEEAEKSRKKTAKKSTPSSQESATWSSKSTSSFPSANCVEQNCNQKHQLGTLLHSTEWRKRFRIRVCRIVETCVKFVHSQRTDAEHVSTVEPSIAPTKKVVSRRIQISYS